VEYLSVQLVDVPPRASIDHNGDRAATLFGERWPIVYRMLELAVEGEMNVNADRDGEFPDTSKMTGRAEIQSVEYGADFRGEPTATYLVRCNALAGGYHLSLEVVLGVQSDGESLRLAGITIA
jgi:hypothetical protein